MGTREVSLPTLEGLFCGRRARIMLWAAAIAQSWPQSGEEEVGVRLRESGHERFPEGAMAPLEAGTAGPRTDPDGRLSKLWRGF